MAHRGIFELTNINLRQQAESPCHSIGTMPGDVQGMFYSVVRLFFSSGKVSVSLEGWGSCFSIVLYVVCLMSCFCHRRRYQKQINSDTVVANGGAKPIQKREEGSMWLNAHDSGTRNRKVAIRLCTMGNQELPCPLK